MYRVLPLLVLATGCDVVFDLDAVPPPPSCPDAVDHDEDLDGIDDECDPCPFDENNLGDIDDDGIANACDPQPMNANTRLLFSGFGPGSSTQFEITGGGVADDTFRAVGSGSAALLWGDTLDDIFLIAGVDVGQLADEDYREVGVMFDAVTTAGTQVNGTLCVLGNMRPDNEYMEVFTRRRPDGDLVIKNTEPAVPLMAIVAGKLVAYHTRSETPTPTTTTACTFGAGGNETSISATRTTLPEPGRAGFFVSNVDARFSYIFIVSRD